MSVCLVINLVFNDKLLMFWRFHSSLMQRCYFYISVSEINAIVMTGEPENA